MDTIQQAVDAQEKLSESQGGWKRELLRIPGILLGVLVYSVGINLFLRPLHLYSGGFMGFAQLADTFLRDVTGRDISGILYYAMNLPALIVAVFVMRRRFVIKSLLAISLITLALTIIPIPDQPVLEETIANCLVAGLLSGAGSGMILRMGSCDGGMNLVGMILIQRNGRSSVGKINLAANLVLYGICMLLFDVPTVIYSLLYSVVASLTCDRAHTQNINLQVMIITKMKDTQPLEVEIMGRLHRGMTRWEAVGSYTGERETILMAAISKYEVAQLRSIVHRVDPHAFVLINEGVGVDGYFLKKLT